MAIVTIRPTASLSRTTHWDTMPGPETEPGTIWGTKLSDDLDTTYARVLDPATSYINHLELSVGDLPAIPSGAKIQQVRVRDRKYGSGDFGAPRIETGIRVGSAGIYQTSSWIDNNFVWVTETGPWRTTTPEGAEWTIATVDALRLRYRIRSEGTAPAIEGRVGEVWVDVEYNEAPVASAIEPSGTVTDTSSPLATWQYSDTEGDPQESFRVVVEEGDTTANGEPDAIILAGGGGVGYTGIYDSGRVYSGATSHVLPPMQSGVYTVWVRVYQAWPTEHSSQWAGSTFTINVTPPNVPDLSATPNTNDSFVLLGVSDPGWPSSPVETADFQIQYSVDGGISWRDTRLGAVMEAVNGAASESYYEAPPSIEVLYRARARAYDLVTADPIVSNWSASVAATLVLDRWWLKCPLEPGMNMKVQRMDLVQNRTRSTRGTAFFPLGRKDAVVVGGIPTSAQFSHNFLTTSQDELDELMELFDTGHVLLLASPRAQWYVRTVGFIDEAFDIRNDPGVYCAVGVEFAEVAEP